jgi:hypothetical protein
MTNEIIYFRIKILHKEDENATIIEPQAVTKTFMTYYEEKKGRNNPLGKLNNGKVNEQAFKELQPIPEALLKSLPAGVTYDSNSTMESNEYRVLGYPTKVKEVNFVLVGKFKVNLGIVDMMTLKSLRIYWSAE